MPQKIDVIDKKIAFLLCRNARISNTAIGKALKLKREVVSYRIKKMQERGFLNGFVARINPRKLGFIVHFVYLKLKTPVKEKEMVEGLLKFEEVNQLQNIGGKFDFQIVITTKNIEEFDTVLRKIFDKYGLMIQDYALLNRIEEEFSDLDFLVEDKKELEKLKSVRETKGSSFQKELERQKKGSETIELDELDRKILSLIKLNARINLKEIAQKTKSNFPLVQKRIKHLVEEGVITTFTAFFSLAYLGLQTYPVLFNFRNIDEQKLKTFLEVHPHLLWSYKFVGNWNYQINIFARNNAHFHDILNDLREAFAENIVSFDSVMVFNSFKVDQRVE